MYSPSWTSLKAATTVASVLAMCIGVSSAEDPSTISAATKCANVKAVLDQASQHNVGIYAIKFAADRVSQFARSAQHAEAATDGIQEKPASERTASKIKPRDLSTAITVSLVVTMPDDLKNLTTDSWKAEFQKALDASQLGGEPLANLAGADWKTVVVDSLSYTFESGKGQLSFQIPTRALKENEVQATIESEIKAQLIEVLKSAANPFKIDPQPYDQLLGSVTVSIVPAKPPAAPGAPADNTVIGDCGLICQPQNCQPVCCEPVCCEPVCWEPCDDGPKCAVGKRAKRCR